MLDFFDLAVKEVAAVAGAAGACETTRQREGDVVYRNFLYWITAFRILCRFARFFSLKHIIIVISVPIS